VQEDRPLHRFAAVLFAIAAVGLVVATLYAARAGAAGRTILGELAIPIDAAIAVGEALYRGAGVWMGAVRLPALAAAVLWLAWLFRQPVERRAGQLLAVALCVGWIAQSYLLDGRAIIGTALYAGVLAVASLVRKPPLSAGPPSARLEMVALIGFLALFTVVCLYRLEVHPNLYVDEMAYLRAARMFAGQIDVGAIFGAGFYRVYVYDQFVAQAIPLVLQAGAVTLLPSDVVATRLLSMVAVAVAVLVAVLALRRPLGPRSTLWMLALCACAPLVVVYSRAGHYISVSVLHAVLCFASLLWLSRRWDVPSALVTGVALGCSLYQYQLSWFVPVFAGAMFLASPEFWRRPGVIRVVASVAIAGCATALPGLIWLDTGFDAVNAQTFDRAVWNVPGAGGPESPHERRPALVVVPDSVDEAGLEAFVARAESRGLNPTQQRTVQGETVVWIGGHRAAVEAMAEEVRRDAWLVLDFDGSISKNPGVRLHQMLAQLFYASSWESSGRWVGSPLINPLLAPLLVVGVILAWRRRREPAVRLLLIWAVGGALLPAVVGGAAPRRTSLMLPFVYGLMALPVVELTAGLRRNRPWGRAAAAALSAALFGAVACTNTYLYFREWDHQQGIPGGGGMILDFVKVLKKQPVDEVVLMPAMYRGLDKYLDAGEGFREWPEMLSRPLNSPARVVRTMSCDQPLPFTWMAWDTPAQRAALAPLEEHFQVETEITSGIRVLRVTATRDDICRRSSRRHPSPSASD
jgi:4-amino-4-deoxy-L-arabinose transferase-like glycosyltransferase